MRVKIHVACSIGWLPGGRGDDNETYKHIDDSDADADVDLLNVFLKLLDDGDDYDDDDDGAFL